MGLENTYHDAAALLAPDELLLGFRRRHDFRLALCLVNLMSQAG
jgi:hypothetical protein